MAALKRIYVSPTLAQRLIEAGDWRPIRCSIYPVGASRETIRRDGCSSAPTKLLVCKGKTCWKTPHSVHRISRPRLVCAPYIQPAGKALGRIADEIAAVELDKTRFANITTDRRAHIGRVERLIA